MTAGADVEFETVPRAHHVDLGLGKFHARAGAIGGNAFFDLGDDLSLARRTADMRADVFIGEEFATELEYADFDSARFDQLAAGI